MKKPRICLKKVRLFAVLIVFLGLCTIQFVNVRADESRAFAVKKSEISAGDVLNVTGDAIAGDPAANNDELGEVPKKDLEALKDTKALELYLTVNQKKVYYPEVMVYVLGSRDSLETESGMKGFWNEKIDGNTVSFLVADDIRRELIQLKVIVGAAEDADVGLTDEEENELMETAKAQLQNVSPEIKARYYIDENVLYKVYHDNFLAAKFYKNYTDATSEATAKELFTDDFREWYKGSDIKIEEDKWKNLDVGTAGEEDLASEGQK